MTTPVPPPAKSRSWIGVAKYVIGFALLALVISLNWEGKDGAPGLKDLIQRTPDFTMFGVAAVLAVGTIGMQYVRWYVLVRALDLPFTFRNAVRLGMVGTFYNTFLPGSVGGDFVKAFFIAQGHPTRKPAAVATVIADRLLGLFGLAVIAGTVGGMKWLSGDANLAANPFLRGLIVACITIVLVGTVGYTVIGFLSHHFADRLAGRLHRLPKVGPTLAELWFTARQYRARPKAILAGVGLSAVSHTFMMLMFHFAVRIYPPLNADFTVNENLIGTLAEHLVIAPIGFIGQALVPLPGGLGAAEFGFGRLYEMIRPGGGRVVGLTGRLALRVIEWCMGGVCYLMYLRMKAELPAQDGERAEVTSQTA